MKKVIVFVVFCFSSFSSAQAVYLVDRVQNPVTTAEASGINHDFQDVCIINTDAPEKSVYGTGTFLSNNVVLTACHVVCLDPCKKPMRPFSIRERLLSSKFITVERLGETIKVRDILVYKEGQDDIALLILDSSIPNCTYRKTRSLRSDEKIPFVTIVGYGCGRIISKDKVFSEDVLQAYRGEGRPFFRYRKVFDFIAVLEQKTEGHGPILKVESPFAWLAEGDSGSPLIAPSGDIIGIAKGTMQTVRYQSCYTPHTLPPQEASRFLGHANFYQTEKRVIEKIENDYLIASISRLMGRSLNIGIMIASYCLKLPTEDWEWGQGLDWRSCVKMLEGYYRAMSSTQHTMYSSIYKKQMSKRNMKIFQGIKEGNTHVTEFTSFDDEIIGWINKVVKDTRRF